ncbi:TonB-dependent siderophore receptor [Pseudomonas entomophila]|uniref:TonB-dependent siderophore receptor n=1 Tax=Pseudomonas entomophila TaxID=312306 RepID=UPI0015E2A312|nr:TonB-dependent siderophore receptor [Pseudomonas entomophila]MBA1187669.1 TonB-dependent siderophore receptor [Pseudomonas entomophila]
MRRSIVSLCLLHALPSLALAETPVTPSASIELGAVNIEADASDWQTADGPVQGYKAERSASATRTDTALHETPQSVSVVPRDVLKDTSATRLQEGLDYAGGVGRANNFGGQGLTTLTVRGFTTGEFYRNGFPINRGYPNAPDANTVERLEVIRGPASTLYGRGDPGGTFNIVSKQPQLDDKVTVGSQIDDQGLRRATLDATGALTQDGALAYRLNVLGEGGESFRDDVDSERYGVTPVLSWQVDDATRIVFEGDFMRNNHPLDRGLTRLPRQAGTASRDTNVWEKGSDNLLHNDNDMAQLRFEHRLDDDWTLAGGLQWLDGSLKGNAVEANGLQADGRTLGRNFNYRELEWTSRDYQLNLTGHFDTAGLSHTLLTGLEYEDYDYSSIILRSAGGAAAYPVDLFNPVLGQPRPALTRTTTHDRENLKTWAAFAQDQVALTERLKALAGVRFERFEHDYDDKLSNARDFSNGQNGVTPRVGLMYDLTETLALYGTASRSFKPNSGTSLQGGGFDPEKGKSYEIGLKWESLDRRLSVDAAVYHTVKENVLTRDPNDPTGTYSVAAGEVRSRGFDLNIAGNITPEWRMIGGYAYVDAEVTRDNTLARGTRLANIPRNTFSLLNTYEFQEGAAKGLGLGVGFKHVDDRAGQTAVSTYTMDQYSVVDLLSFYTVNEHVRLNLDVKNVFNTRYDEGAFNTYVYPGAPRTVQAGVSYTF